VKTRPRKPKGVSMSTVRVVERIARQGSRATRRAVSAWQRRQMEGGFYAA
jgi:hypothetical protein